MSRRNRTLLASLALAGAATALAAPSPSAAAPRAGSSIVGGGPADPGQWPFAVAIFRKKRLHCGGSVIAPTKVLTAAHCVDGFNLSNFQVIAGRPNLRNGSAGQAVLVASGRVHPDFQQTALHDIAVLNLAQPTTVTPVALATPAENSAIAVPGTSLRVAGYGAVNPFGVRLSPVLKSTFEIVRTDRRCLKAYTRDLFAPESMICARQEAEARRALQDPHQRLHGRQRRPVGRGHREGAGRARHRLLRRRVCGPPQAPSVYSRVSSALDFINAG